MKTWKRGQLGSGRRTNRSMLCSLRTMRRSGCEVRPGSGMRIPIAFTSSTVRVRAARVISWKSACARL